MGLGGKKQRRQIFVIITERLISRVLYINVANPFIVIKFEIKSTANRIKALIAIVKSPKVIQISGAKISFRMGRTMIFPSVRSRAMMAIFLGSVAISKPGMYRLAMKSPRVLPKK